MSGNWTPGPWPCEPTGDGKRFVIGDGLVDGPNGYEVAEVYSDDCDPVEAAANAHLIAAAPCLYEALKDVLRSARKDFGPGLKGETQFKDAYREAFAALAKARGEA